MKTLLTAIVLAIITINGMKTAKEYMTDLRVAHEQRIEIAISGR